MWELLVPAITSILDKIIPDPAARAEAQLKLVTLQLNKQLVELESATKVIVAEASGNWLQKSWRPVLMLTFGALIIARWFGLTAPNLTEAEYLHLWDIVELGIGGYVIGRSAEKIIPQVAESLGKGK
jgi:hypothetical protein